MDNRTRPPRPAPRVLLTAHIVISVGLLGDSAGFLAVAIRAARTHDPAAARTLVETLNMFAWVFGVPLSFGAILTGIALGLTTGWGVFGYPWVVSKLVIIVSVMLIGGLVIGPATNRMLAHGVDTTARLIAAATFDVVVLTAAATLGVFKPGRRLARLRRTPQSMVEKR